MGARRVVVVGGTGFVGRHVSAALAARGDDVLVLARRVPSAGLPYRARALDVATLEPAALAAVFDAEQPDAVVNATGGKWNLTDAELPSSCTIPTWSVTAALERTRCRPRLVHLGSVLERVQEPPGAPAGATVPTQPESMYGRAKLAATQAVLAATRAGSVDATVLRLANVVGPGVPPDSLLGRVVVRLVDAAGRDRSARVELSPLRAHRDYVDVRDVAEAVVSATRESVTGRVIGVGRGEAVPVRSLVEMLIEVSGVPTEVVELPDRPGSVEVVDWARVDPGPARDLLGWRPRRSLRDAVGGLWDEAASRLPDRSRR
ncbi:NDP-hexose 4-ketoreductase [Micromonospora sp. ATCC 39149]|uniref:NAD-dependent epimerase/dehydratase family protein n=1 Tax=Micromonospora sp. (strain ATCC 39149 / NRRL 15099 / SCC 1413) TaxID=219305 RepID=UPI000003F18E|nr:NAD(P)-dependent oxidoreductase [Micromonospora sp. ATCC 39149]EEP73326.1 NDP-hexose 4-ketoreductase [Micromonospora sp. ATCC 39149]